MATLARPGGPSMPRMVRWLTSGTPLPAIATQLHREYPRIAHIYLPGEHIYSLHHADLVRSLFFDHGSGLRKADALKKSAPLLGNGLLTSEGDEWRRNRKMVQPSLHVKHLHHYAEVMGRKTSDASRRWQERASIDVSAEMTEITLDIVGECLFGDALGADALTIGPALDHVLVGTERRFTSFGRLFARVPTKRNRQANHGVTYLSRFVDDMIDRHRQNHTGTDLLTMLLHEVGEDGTPFFSHRQLADEVMTLILAGHETTAMALTWSFFLLSHNPEQRKLLHEEIDSVVTDGSLGFDTFALLPYTRAVLAESLRLFPPGWLMGRKTTEAIELDGWHIPARSSIAFWPYVLQRDERFWQQPAAFDPSRWLDANGKFDDDNPGQPLGSWLAFGIGQRKCVGQMFAWMEGTLALATLARRWDLHIPDADPAFTTGITLRPKGGLHATLTRRL